jgi:hypothetical protein
MTLPKSGLATIGTYDPLGINALLKFYLLLPQK